MTRKALWTGTIIVLLAALLGVFFARSRVTLRLLALPREATVVHMVAGGFEPREVTIWKSSTICFRNEDTEARWPASAIHPTHGIYPEFDPKLPVRSGEDWCFTFDLAGIWRYHDHLFPDITGAVHVQGK